MPLGVLDRPGFNRFLFLEQRVSGVNDKHPFAANITGDASEILPRIMHGMFVSGADHAAVGILVQADPDVISWDKILAYQIAVCVNPGQLQIAPGLPLGAQSIFEGCWMEEVILHGAAGAKLPADPAHEVIMVHPGGHNMRL